MQGTENTGKVKFYNSEKGYGFIVNEETSKDIFFHMSGITDHWEPQEGDKVAFNVGQNNKGESAIDISKCN